MKRFLLALFSVWCFLYVFEGRAQFVTIPDPGFAAYLSNHPGFSSCISGNQLDTACVHLAYQQGADQTLYLTSMGFTDLEGIQYFDGLESIFADYNSLTHLPVLPNSLHTLSVEYNAFTDLPLLPNTLRYLYITGNLIDSITVLPDSLKELHASSSGLSYVQSLPAHLEWLLAPNNNLNSLPALPSMLQRIDVSNNQLTELPLLPSNLRFLFCSNNMIEGTILLPDSLWRIICYDNSIDTILCQSTQLIDIRAWNNQLKLLSGILPATLTDLHVTNNQLTGLPALPNTLRGLSVGSNPMPVLPALPDSLTGLECVSNNIASIPALPSQLTGLFCANNLLTSLPPIPPGLLTLYCSHNHLTSLPGLNENMDLDISYNPITCLPPVDELLSLAFDSTFISCRPNPVIVHYGVSPFNDINALPLCSPSYNPNSCETGYNIMGFVFNDSNGNCVKDLSENYLTNIPVLLFKDSLLIEQTYTSNGVYIFDTSIDTFRVVIDTANLPFTATCTGSDSLIYLSASDSIAEFVNFSMVCSPGSDIGVVSVANTLPLFFPGLTPHIGVRCGDLSNCFGSNNCSAGTNGTIVVTYNGPVSYINSIPGTLTPDSVSNNSIYYTISDFSAIDFNNALEFEVLTDTSAQAGDTVCINVIITTSSGDNNPSNNIYHQCFSVFNSYDPNMKEVSPPGPLQFPFEDWLTYTIHFQNTGTYQAFNIRLEDQLDTDLDPATFELLSYSHPVQTSIQGQHMTFNFFNINLLDSTSNEPESHGYVQYRIKPYPSRPYNTDIANTAHIYFDYNPAVITNTTHSLITDLHVGLSNKTPKGETKLYPNPAHNSLTIQTDQTNYAYELSTIDGKTIRTGYSEKTITSIDISDLGTAVYFLKVISGKGVTVSKFIKQ